MKTESKEDLRLAKNCVQNFSGRNKEVMEGDGAPEAQMPAENCTRTLRTKEQHHSESATYTGHPLERVS